MTYSVRLMFISNETETDVFPTQHSSHKKVQKLLFIHYQETETRKNI